MAELAKNRAPLPTGIPVDRHRLVTGAEQRELERFDAARRVLRELGPKLPATLHVMRDSSAGQPRAAATHQAGDGGAEDDRRRFWCGVHERSLGECDPADRSCSVDPERSISDPTGQAAVGFDHAERDRRQLLKLLDTVVRASVDIHRLIGAYPAVAVERVQLGGDDEVGTVWCRSCWRDSKYCEPVGVRTSGEDAGKPYYAGLCRWCGSLGFEPPMWLVKMRHDKKQIKSEDLDRARKEVAGSPRPQPKAQNRK